MVTAAEGQQAATEILMRLGLATRTRLSAHVVQALTDGRRGVEMSLSGGRRLTVVETVDGRYSVQVSKSGIAAAELSETVLRMAKA